VRFAIVRALFNADITERLLAGARRAFQHARVPARNVKTFEVPGSFELPLAALWLAQSGKYDAIVCLGCIIRGDTPHFYYVAAKTADGIAEVGMRTGVPAIFGVLTTENVRQALERAADVEIGRRDHAKKKRRSNKGYEAAQSAIVMGELRRRCKAK
jgi:6,7-dimethyl-8-ribityllumazine synthase